MGHEPALLTERSFRSGPQSEWKNLPDIPLSCLMKRRYVENCLLRAAPLTAIGGNGAGASWAVSMGTAVRDGQGLQGRRRSKIYAQKTKRGWMFDEGRTQALREQGCAHRLEARFEAVFITCVTSSVFAPP